MSLINEELERKERPGTIISRWKQLFVNPGHDPTKTLTRAYILALSLIAILTVSVHIVTAHITKQQKESAEIAYHIGRQRALMQQIMLYATNYFRLGEGLDYDFMLQSLWELEKGHDYLLKTIDTRSFAGAVTSPTLYRVYHNPPFSLDDQVKKFSKLMGDFSEFSARDESEQRKELLDKLGYMSTNILRPAMDAALETYQTETLEKMARYYSIQLAGAIFILIVLIAEAALIFRPLIGKIKKYNTVLQRYALEDALTGLNNRRAFMNNAENELKRAQRDKTPVIVALLDLDHFKKINDNYGHEVGDHVLRHFSGIFKQAFRGSDITGRIGGEEFAIMLPRIDRKGAQAILQRLCDTVAQTPCQYKSPGGVDSTLHYTISIGFTGPTRIADQNIDGLLGLADEALYEAKAQGRNRVIANGG